MWKFDAGPNQRQNDIPAKEKPDSYVSFLLCCCHSVHTLWYIYFIMYIKSCCKMLVYELRYLFKIIICMSF